MKHHRILGKVWMILAVLLCATAARAAEAQRLKVALVQLGLEATLAENRDKIARLAGEAAAGGARLVVFPEGALAAQKGAPEGELQAAREAIAKAAREKKIYIVTGAAFFPKGQARHHNQLYVFGPGGETLLVYDKVWSARKYEAPKMVEIDGVPCSFIICADRWSRPLEGIPPVMGAKIIIECSNNYYNEWLPQLGWYWYVPRAIRNTAFVIFSNSARENRSQNSGRGHGHSAIIAPDGRLLAGAGDERDRIVTAELNMNEATRAMAIRRGGHPLFKAWWALGRAIYEGRKMEAAGAGELISSENSVKAGFGLMTVGRSIENNLKTMQGQIKEAADKGLDLVVFPELAVTGDNAEDIRNADAGALAAAVKALCAAARKHKLTVVFGAPALANGKLRNSAYVAGPDGRLLTRYDQIAVGRPDLFEGGMSTKAMWFQVNGVWSIVTIGDDAIWNEMAELAALRGARVICHLRHARALSPEHALRDEQVLTHMASFRTLTIVANPIFPELKGNTEALFFAGAGVWDDLEAGQWCAVKTVSGRPWDGVYSAPRIVPGARNAMRVKGYWMTTLPQFKPWMMAGVETMDE